MNNVPDCIATGWVDMNTGMLLGVKTVDGHCHEALDPAAAASAEVVHGSNAAAISQVFAMARDTASAEQYFRELTARSQSVVHVFACGKNKRHQMLVVVTPVSANLGTVITRTRAALSTLEAVG